jgi:hypothetical protein
MNSLVLVIALLARLLLRAMNDFPLFAILLRIKDARRLPGTQSRLGPCIPDHGYLTLSFMNAFIGAVYIRPAVGVPRTLLLEVVISAYPYDNCD